MEEKNLLLDLIVVAAFIVFVDVDITLVSRLDFCACLQNDV